MHSGQIQVVGNHRLFGPKIVSASDVHGDLCSDKTTAQNRLQMLRAWCAARPHKRELPFMVLTDRCCFHFAAEPSIDATRSI